MRNSVLALMMAVMSSASGGVVGYHTDPVKASWSGWTTFQNNYVAQSVVACWDSLDRVELFAGAKGNGGAYTAIVYEGGAELTRSAGNGVPEHGWVKFSNWDQQVAFTKGKTLTVRFTRGGGDSLQYYYSGNDPYQYGGMAVGQQVPIPNPNDLACRVYGRMNPVSDVWRACANHGYDPPRSGRGDTALGKAKSMGIKWLRDEFMGWHGWEDDSEYVKGIHTWYAESGFSMVGMLLFGSSDTGKSSRGSGTGDPTMYPPRHLWPLDSSQVNYWAQYCHDILVGLPEVEYWCVWPEMNANWYWKNPDPLYYKDRNGEPIDTPRDRCSLYVRMCRIAESTARVLGGSPRRKIVGGETARLIEPIDDGATGVEWLEWMFDIAKKDYGAAESCFDIVSVHPYIFYEWPNYFREDVFRTNLDTARWAMRQAGCPGMELWATEYGWPRWWNPGRVPTTDTLLQADNICKFYTSALARQADPRGGYDRAIHYELTSHHSPQNTDNNGFGLLESLDSQPLVPAGWAFAQESLLTGKRLNGRVMTGGTKDDSVRVYEFEDPETSHRTWVCWKNAGEGQGAVSVNLPARADTSACTVLDYGDNPQEGDSSALASGWLPHALTERPVFITEKSDTTRPDNVVDSLKLVPSPLIIGSPATAHVYFHNAGNAATPEGPATGQYGFVVLRHNGDSVAQAVCTSQLDPDSSGSVSIGLGSVPAGWLGSALFDATVNYQQGYVELNGMDDNDGFSRTSIVWGPVGELLSVQPGSHSNEPLSLLSFETHSIQADTTGETPCDSARLVQWWYGLNDTVVHGGDTTAWFDASAAVALDTSWLYLFGQGRYSAYLQVKDSWSMSDLIPDTTHQYVIFDTTGPSGSVVINSGDRFTTSSTCTLALAASDSASGVCKMRFMNVPKVDLVVGGSFTATAGSWIFTNGEVDTLLHMARLTVTPVEARVRQFIPAESISAYSGDSCVLQASVMALMHGGNALGDLSFFNYFCRTDTSLHDTSWTLVDSATFQDSLAFWGQAPGAGNTLARRFLLTTPAAESGWVWRGGMVRVQAVGINGATGTVWADQVALMGFQPDTGYAWWGPYETLTTWNIGTSAGQHIVRALYLDSAGNENAATIADTIILDPTAPVVDISQPGTSQLVNGVVEITGVAYDTIEVPGDTWFQRRTLSYRRSDSTNWLPVLPDSCSHVPAYPDSQQILGPAVHLGYWNTLSVPNGQYYLRLTATDSAGHVSSCSTWVMVFHGGGGGMGNGPEGGGSGLGEGSVFVGSATGTVLHLSDALDSLDGFSVSDSGSQANVTAILEVGNDSLLVLDAANKRIHKLHKSGQHRRRLVSNLSQPADLKRDDNGNLWLADRGWNRIGKFRSNGTLVFVRGGLGADSLHFDAPEGIAVKGSLVYVADGGNDRICVWDTSGNYRATVTGDFENPTAVHVTDEGTIYLTDGSDGKLKGITSLGGSIVALGTEDSSKLKGLVPSENRHSLFSVPRCFMWVS